MYKIISDFKRQNSVFFNRLIRLRTALPARHPASIVLLLLHQSLFQRIHQQYIMSDSLILSAVCRDEHDLICGKTRNGMYKRV